MSQSLTLPAAFPLVGLGIFGTVVLHGFQMSLVIAARKASGVAYPTLYASEADAAADPKKRKFNCTQRAHANTLENIPYILASYVFFSVFHPKAALALIGAYLFGRVFYTLGYSSGVPMKRNNPLSALSYIGLFGLVLGSAFVSVTRSFAVLF